MRCPMTKQGETIFAFTRFQRSFHNHLLHFMIMFIITGLPIFSTHFSFIAWLFALPFDFMGSVFPDLATTGITENARLALGLQVVRVIHRLTAFFFIIMAIPFCISQLVHIKDWAIWPEGSWGPSAFMDGIKNMVINYIGLRHARFGKFNMGQKLFAWTIIFAMIAITVSGGVLMFRDFFSQDTQEISRMIHALSFVVITLFLIVHLYLSLLPMNRKALEAMFGDGKLPLEYVKEHHEIWYEKLVKKRVI